MSDAAVKLLRDAARAQEQLANGVPALDEILLFALERRYLGVGEFENIILEQQEELLKKQSLVESLRSRVRLLQIDEICFSRNDRFHLPGVESVLSSMRDCGHSLVFVVCGEVHRTRVFVGLSQFLDDVPVSLDAALEGYRSAWMGHFPGSRVRKVTDEECRDISHIIGRSTDCGVLTGIPSLKRSEESEVFVQGIERLIRVLRGHSYSWVSIADPIGLSQINEALDASRNLRGEVHHLAKTTLSKGVSNGKTVMMGMFGLMGRGETDGTSFSESTSSGITESEGKTQQRLEGYQRAGSALPVAGGVIGGILGSIVPGAGTAVGAMIGGTAGTLLSSAVKGLGSVITGDAGHAITKGTSLTNTRAFTNTASRALAHQMAGGGFGSFGLSWTKTTNVGQELLNRKAEYCEELLTKHEERLQEGSTLGMWNVGHYFCSEDAESFSLGQAVVRSLFSGMDSYYEPPRMIRLPKDSAIVIRRFANLYISFPNDKLRDLFDEPLPDKSLVVANHPLGFWFNGVGTPMNTRELAIATPIARQDVEGITVTERASFGVNLESEVSSSSVTVGTVQDRGEMTLQKYRLMLDNLPKHVGVFGLTGSGKTNTVCNILEQLWKVHRIPFMVIEPAKSEYRSLAQSEALANDLVVISAGVERSESCPLRINPFEYEPGQDTDAGRVHLLTHVDRLKATFNATFPMYASMPYILEEAILEVYRERGWDLGRSCNRFVDVYSEPFHDYIPTLRDLYFKIDSIVHRKGYWVEQQMNIEAAIKARLSSLMVGAKGSMLNCNRSIPAADLFNRPVVIELKHLGDDDEKAFVMGLLVSWLYEYREAGRGESQHSQCDLKHLLVVEEAHRLLKNIPEGAENMETANVKAKAVTSFVDMLSEIRAYGQGVVVVDQVPSRLNANIIKGTAAKIVHRLLAEDDRQMVGKCMGLVDDQIADISLLETGQCVVHQDGQRKAFLCQASLNQSHEKNQSGGTSAATNAFRLEHAGILNSLHYPDVPLQESVLTDVDSEDAVFCASLHRAMLAIAFSPVAHSSTILELLNPTRYDIKEERLPSSSKRPWMWLYWKQISDEVWAYYTGEYRDFLSFRDAGWCLLDHWCRSKSFHKEHSIYVVAVADYIGLPRPNKGVLQRNVVANVYNQLITRSEAIVAIRDRFNTSSLQTDESQMDKITRCIVEQMILLLPRRPYFPSDQLISGILDAILWRFKWSSEMCRIVTVRVQAQFHGGMDDA